MSMRQLHRILRSLDLRRHSRVIDWERTIDTVGDELMGTGGDLGYRAMHARLRLLHDINISRENVRLILRYMDPEGVSERKRRRLVRRQYSVKGPNYLYHIDGWDKLKTYGLCIHGCIYGFSRRIIWLKAGPSNKNPFVVCKYFAESARMMQGLPCVIRADRGTENVNIELMQSMLRLDNEDHRAFLGTTFMYGSSPANQRIESWWSKFPSLGIGTWIRHFKQLEENGIIDTSKELDKECIRYCYMDILRDELHVTRIQWNVHYIRSMKNTASPSGKPDNMFYLPQMYQTRSYLLDVDETNQLNKKSILILG